MKLKICIICATRSLYTNFERDPSNGCDPDCMDHGSSWTDLGPYIYYIYIYIYIYILKQKPLSLD